MIGSGPRSMDLPSYLRIVEGQRQLLGELQFVLGSLGLLRPAAVSGPSSSRSYGDTLAKGLAIGPDLFSVSDNSIDSVERLTASVTKAKADVLIAVGGGRVIDVAKSACGKAGIPVVVVPTLLSADGICSPVSVLSDGKVTASYPALLPTAVVADLGAIATAPVSTVKAGIGDLIANPSALADWRLAEREGKEEVDDFAALLAQTATDLVWQGELSEKDLSQPTFLRRLLEGLVLSGLAMEIAGSSRPCSGAEHLISHAIDSLNPGTATHGEQVAFGTVIATYLRGGDWQAVRAQLRSVGMDSAVRGFGLTPQQITKAVKKAPSTREGRYTVLDEADLSGIDFEKIL